jgi:hypothetical protein
VRLRVPSRRRRNEGRKGCPHGPNRLATVGTAASLALVVDCAVRESRKFLLLFLCLRILFGRFAQHESILLPEAAITYGQGFAIVNALVSAMVMLVADHLDVGENFETRPLVYPVLFKSTVFAVILICFDLIEEVGRRHPGW